MYITYCAVFVINILDDAVVWCIKPEYYFITSTACCVLAIRMIVFIPLLNKLLADCYISLHSHSSGLLTSGGLRREFSVNSNE